MAQRTGTASTLYRIPIWDVTLPSFTSGTSYAYGTEGDVSRFMSVRRRALAEMIAGDSEDDELLCAYRKWVGGENPVVHVAYHEQPFAEIVEPPLSTLRIVSKRHDEMYTNAYGCPYDLHAETVSYDVMLVRTGNGCLRLVKADVSGMTIGSDFGGRHAVDSAWGEAGILDLRGDGSLSTTMFLVEHAYDDVDSALAATLRRPSLSLAPVMNHIVADG